MRHLPERHDRRSIRLKGYDYTAGTYFVTICTHDRACLFGEIIAGNMVLNEAGRIVEKCWRNIPAHFPHVALDDYVIMPNHVHGILAIVDSVGAKHFSPLQSVLPGTSKSIGSVIRGLKIGVTNWMRANTDVHNVWQRNYYEHIIRDEPSLARIREYIANNPAVWSDDPENPAARGIQP